MSDDDDWFERAVGKEADDGEDAEETDAADDPDEAEATDAADGSEVGVGVDAGGEEADESGGVEFGVETGDAGGEGGDAPFDRDFASALENAPDPGEAGGPDAGARGQDAEGFGGFGGGQDDFGGLGGGQGGFEGFGGGTTSFDEEDVDFESDIERVEIGIEGLDEMILGGVPTRSLMAVVGSAGTGKTTFGLQFIQRALERDGRAVYITLEESKEHIVDTADEKGWDFSAHVEAERLAVVDFDPIEMANSLSSISSELPSLIEEFGADRLVLDSVSLLEMMYDHPSRRRSQVFEFTRSLKEAGVTTMVTSEASEETAYASRYGIIEYLADAVFVLQYIRPSDFRETRLAVEIQKIRDANHSRETKPYEITSDGISVYRQANIF